MNMHVSRCMLLLGLMFIAACRSDDQYLYEVNTLDVLASNDHKSRQKSEDQYLATLYTNLYQQSVSGNKLADMREVLASFGDKDLGRQMLISRLLVDPDINIPTQEEMRANLDAFVEGTNTDPEYKRTREETISRTMEGKAEMERFLLERRRSQKTSLQRILRVKAIFKSDVAS